MTLNRNVDLGNRPPVKPPRPRGEGSGPTGGLFWLRGTALIPITGTCNEIVALSGQVVIQHPEDYGLTPDAISTWLAPYGDMAFSPLAEFQRFLANPTIDLTHGAWLYKSSKVVYEQMLKTGWAWVRYFPPAGIHFAMIENVAKRQIASAAEHFPLLQIDKIMITLVTEFAGLSDKYPQISRNKTLVFTSDEFKGFAGTFGGVLDWSHGQDAPASNFLYFITQMPFHGLRAAQINVATDKGYRKRWGIRFFVAPHPTVSSEMTLGRVPISVLHSITHHKHWQRGISPPNSKGTVTLYSDRWFDIRPADVELLQNGQWDSP